MAGTVATWRGVLLGLSLLTLTACGLAGGWDFEDGPPGEAEDPPPDVVLLFVSGHTGDYDWIPSLSYLDDELGPTLKADLEFAGYEVHADYYVDHPTSTDAAGYDGLVSDMEWIRDHWVRDRPDPPAIVMIAHSHGGVWANAAIREVSDLGIDVQIALDHSSYGWGTTFHTLHDGVIGGDPRNAYRIEAVSECPREPDDDPAGSPWYDLEDVVFPNVWRALEVRSGDPVWPLDDEPYDEHWNVRTNGSTARLHCYLSHTNHDEMYWTTGPTYQHVLAYLMEYLGS